MASNTSKSTVNTSTSTSTSTSLAIAQFQPSTPFKRTRLSSRAQPQNPSQSPPEPSDAMPTSGMTTTTVADPHTALLHGHDHQGLIDRSRHLDNNHYHHDYDPDHDRDRDRDHHDLDDDPFMKSTASKNLEKMITPYLTQHIPHQYNPLGGASHDAPPPTANTKYCYRHRPDMLCRRQADEPSMEQLQKELGHESQQDQQSIANVWSLFSAAPSKHRNLMLQGILAQCCFPQLSFIASSVRNLIKIDFLAALPTELSFQILCHLDTTSLCKAAQVSQKWRQLADDDVVWHRMCEQHIDRKCTKCGWGLPLLDQRRLRTEKRRIQLRASGRGLNEWSPEITPVPESESEHDPPALSLSRSLSHFGQGSASASDLSDPITAATSASVSASASLSKRPAPHDPSASPELSIKRQRVGGPDAAVEAEPPKKRPWKDVYKDRFKVGTNWKYGRYSTRVLKGHTNGVMCLQFDDRILMTGSYDQTVRIWDLETGGLIRTLTGHTAGIRCLHFDDVRLITGSQDHTIKVWNWRTGACIRTLHGHRGSVIGIHMAGTLLASGSADHNIVIHDFSTYQRHVLQGHTDWVNSVKIDLPSRTLFSASDDCTVKLWDLDTRVCLKTFEGHVGQVQQVLPLPEDFELDEVDFLPHANNDISNPPSPASEHNVSQTSTTPDGASEPLFPRDPSRPLPPSYMLTGSLDGTIRLWHVPSGRCVHRFFGHVEGIWSLAADSLRLVSGAEDKTIKIWDPRTGKHERTLTGHEGPVNCVGLSDSKLISGSMDGTIRVHCFVSEDGEAKEKSEPEVLAQQ